MCLIKERVVEEAVLFWTIIHIRAGVQTAEGDGGRTAHISGMLILLHERICVLGKYSVAYLSFYRVQFYEDCADQTQSIYYVRLGL